MNFINLLNTIEKQIDYTTFKILYDDFLEEYRREYKNIKPCKSAMEKARKNYAAKALYKDSNVKGLYSTGTTAIILSHDIDLSGKQNFKAADMSNMILQMMKTKSPVDCYFIESIALYKVLKKQEKSDYYLVIDNHVYNAALVLEVLECIVDHKEQYIRAEISQHNGALLLNQNGAGLVLPTIYNKCYNAKNVNTNDFFKMCDTLEKRLLYDGISTAV